MPAAILQLELSAPLPAIAGCERYDQLFLVCRWHGRVVGTRWVPLDGGAIDPRRLAAAVRAAMTWPAWRLWLEETLGWDPRHRAGARPPSISVAVCTRDRPDDLARVLEALASLRGPVREILVIDNAPSTDDTQRLVARRPGVRYVREPRAGLDAARNRALAEARGDIVAFTDDDAIPEPGWAEALAADFGDPRVLAVCGLTLPLELETEPQVWFERHCPFGRGFARHVFDAWSDNPLAAGSVGAGANFAIRREVIERVGGFDERLDAGTPTRSGGDHEMFSRILAAGYRIVYEPAAVSWHRHRRTRAALRGAVFGYGAGVYATFAQQLVERREIGVVRRAWVWLRRGQLPALVASVRRTPGSVPIDVILAELAGCAAGPW
ncbi:MAG TPA: glycosyltransferase, partial [Vicinamibacterales bacterium]|nr:glycosyltransferase [Vicinamibacterales bacterium]